MPHINSLLKKSIKRIYDVHISTKIIVPFITLAVVISLVGGFILSSWIVDMINHEAEKDLVGSQSVANAAFENYESNLIFHARTMSKMPGVADQISGGNLSMVRQHLLPMMVNLEADFFEVLDDQGIVVINNNGPYIIGSNIMNEQAVQAASVEVDTSDLNISPSGPVIFAVASTKTSQGNMAGYIILGSYFTNGFLREFKPLVGRDISVFSDTGLMATTLSGRLDETCLSSGCHVEGHTKTLSQDIMTGDTRRVDFANMRGTPYLITHAPFKLHGESVAFYSLFMSLEDIQQTQSAVRGAIFLAAAILMILITTIGYIIGKALAEPIEDLSSLAKKVTGGDLTQRSHYTGTDDEVGELATSFNQMTNSLQRYTNSLRRRVKELSLLYDMSTNASSIYNTAELLDEVTSKVTSTLKASNGCILLSDTKGETLRLTSCFGAQVFPGDYRKFTIEIKSGRLIPTVASRELNAVELEIAQARLSIAALGLNKKTPMLINKSEAKMKTRNLLTEAKAVSVLNVPLRAHDVFGLIQLVRGETRTPFTNEDRDFVATLAVQTATFIENTRLIENLKNSYISTVRALAEAIDAKDEYTRGHSVRVAAYAVSIAKEMKLSAKEIEGIETASYLHDVGKIGVSDKILLKPTKLSGDEIEIIKNHPMTSARILAPIEFPWDIEPIVFQHHEHFDGEGYPSHLKANKISIGARILSVADAYEAMTSDRPYRPALSQKESIEELKKGSGSQFDPDVVDAIIKILDREKQTLKTTGKKKKGPISAA